ncbi:MAG: AAA family ATPase [Lachnospiraceae bacterium]|nr:AAA family ATPase [Lachnospiraceae bacterium]
MTLIARPRRFGKTLNLNMLEKFFSMEFILTSNRELVWKVRCNVGAQGGVRSNAFCLGKRCDHSGI